MNEKLVPEQWKAAEMADNDVFVHLEPCRSSVLGRKGSGREKKKMVKCPVSLRPALPLNPYMGQSLCAPLVSPVKRFALIARNLAVPLRNISRQKQF